MEVLSRSSTHMTYSDLETTLYCRLFLRRNLNGMAYGVCKSFSSGPFGQRNPPGREGASRVNAASAPDARRRTVSFDDGIGRRQRPRRAATNAIDSAEAASGGRRKRKTNTTTRAPTPYDDRGTLNTIHNTTYMRGHDDNVIIRLLLSRGRAVRTQQR